MTLDEIIQRKRSERGLSQEKLAELVGVSRQAVSKWELGDAIPDTDKLVPLCRALGITVDELLGNVPEPQTSQPITLEKQPGWFAAHWYWLGLIPVAWGVIQLVRLIPVLIVLVMNLVASPGVGAGTQMIVPGAGGAFTAPFEDSIEVEIFQELMEIPGLEIGE